MTAPPSTETPRHTATPWILDGTSVYYLDWDGVSYEGKGKNYQKQLTNRFWFPLQGSPKRIPKEELEANAAFIVTAVNSYAALTAKVAELEAELAKSCDDMRFADSDAGCTRAVLADARVKRLEGVLREIEGWKNDTLGARPKESHPHNCAPEITEAFDRGARMAFYRCADRASAALSHTEEARP